MVCQPKRQYAEAYIFCYLHLLNTGHGGGTCSADVVYQ